LLFRVPRRLHQRQCRDAWCTSSRPMSPVSRRTCRGAIALGRLQFIGILGSQHWLGRCGGRGQPMKSHDTQTSETRRCAANRDLAFCFFTLGFSRKDGGRVAPAAVTAEPEIETESAPASPYPSRHGRSDCEGRDTGESDLFPSNVGQEFSLEARSPRTRRELRLGERRCSSPARLSREDMAIAAGAGSRRT
jgi:hypothetical protein